VFQLVIQYCNLHFFIQKSGSSGKFLKVKSDMSMPKAVNVRSGITGSVESYIFSGEKSG